MATINFDYQGSKKITFDVLIENIDPNNLEFRFVISTDGVDLAFPGTYNNGKAQFNIPALQKHIKEEHLNERHGAHLEAISQKYYIKPWEGIATIKMEPKIEISNMTEESGEIKENIDIKVTLIEQEIVEKPPIKLKKKETKIHKFLK